MEFLFVYIREAHPSDGWPMESNTEAGIDFREPKTLAERRERANECLVALPLRMTCVVDGPENAVDAAYAGWPERLFVIERGGTIAYAGKQGPFGFLPEEVADWLRENVGRPVSAPAPDADPPAPQASSTSPP